MSDIVLNGCHVQPLASYMKALGIFKILSEKDNNITASWDKDNFIISTNINRDEIIDFFMNEYAPAPIMSPWNNGSGFYLHSDKDIIKNILNIPGERFSEYKRNIEIVNNLDFFSYKDISVGKFLDDFKTKYPKNYNPQKLSALCDYINKDSDKSKLSLKKFYESYTIKGKEPLNYLGTIVKNYEDKILKKDLLIIELRSKLEDSAIEWIDTCTMINNKNEKITAPLLGSGGNEGNFDYGYTFMDDIYNVLVKFKNNESRNLLQNSIFGCNSEYLKDTNIGKFDPGRAGGYNQGNGIENKKFYMNPWDFIFLMEGIMLWSNSMGRKYGSNRNNYLMSPFTVKSFPAGYPSASDVDLNKSSETWIPVWPNKTHLAELKTLFNEGKVVFSGKIASNGLEFIEGIKSLGIDRGINEYVRYLNVLRRGQSGYVSIPVERVEVHYDKGIDLLKDINPMLKNIRKITSKKEIPQSFKVIQRNIENAVYNLAVRGDANNFQHVLEALGDFEKLMSKNKDITSKNKDEKVYPLTGLNPLWLIKANDNSPEFIIAAALASIKSINGTDIGSIRTNLEPVNSKNDWAGTKENQYSYEGNNIYKRLSNVLYRRLMEAERTHASHIPLDGIIGADPVYVSMFIDNILDVNRIERILFGLLLINWNDRNINEIKNKLYSNWKENKDYYLIDRRYAILKILFSNDMCDNSNIIEKRVVPLLNSNRIKEALKIAENRIYINCQRKIDADFVDSDKGESIAAALLIPIENENLLWNMTYKKIEEVK